MNREQLKHIFDQSSCLTKKQLKGYVNGSMTSEEAHAAELHLNSCPMCSDAVEGLMAEKETGLILTDKINADFLKSHLPAVNTTMQTNNHTSTKINKPAPAMHRAKATKSYFAFRVTTMAAAILLAMAAIWYYGLSYDMLVDNKNIAQNVQKNEPEQPVIQAPVPQETIASVVEDMNAMQDVAADAPDAAKTITQSEATQKNGVVAMADGTKDKDQKDGLLKRLGNKIETAAAKKATQQVIGAIKNDDPDKYATSAKNQFIEEQKLKPKEERGDLNTIEKLPTRSVAPSAGNSYEPVVEDVAGNARNEKETISKTDQADKLLQAGKTNDALNLYTQEMRSASSKGKRQEAAIGAARCYLALGNRYKAKDILISIVNEGGPRKREAKRMLKELGWEE